MKESTREKLLKVALVAFGAIFFLIYPLGLIWPSGWVWHGGEGKYYLLMLCGVYAVLGALPDRRGSEPLRKSEFRSRSPSGRTSCMRASWRRCPFMTSMIEGTLLEMCPRYCSLPPCCGFCCQQSKRGRARHSNGQPADHRSTPRFFIRCAQQR